MHPSAHLGVAEGRAAGRVGEGRGPRVVAGVDIGTNSVRLLVLAAAGAGDPPAVVRREMRITRLGQEVDRTGRLAPAAIRRTLEAVAGYAELWRTDGADAVRVTATSAARDASNAIELIEGIRRIAGVDPEVLSGEEEAALAFRGAADAVPVDGIRVVLDIGGGSTELIRGAGSNELGRVLAATSRQLGSVRLTERFLRADPPTAAQVADTVGHVSADLDAAAPSLGIVPGDRLVGTAGTVTTVAALHLNLTEYHPGAVHGAVVPIAAIADLTRRLLTMRAIDRGRLGPVTPGREDVIHAGALVLHEVMRRFGFVEIVVSEHDILDGIALSLLS